MKIFRVIFDRSYQYLMPESEEIWVTGMLTFDGTHKTPNWNAFETFIFEPKLKVGDFLSLSMSSSSMVATPKAMSKGARTFFEMAGEILPVVCQDTEYNLLNVTECINCLNAEKTIWRVGKDGAKLWLTDYEFHPKRLLIDSSIFKIPETCRGEILVRECSKDPEEEFKAFVENEALEGISFKEVWNSEK